MLDTKYEEALLCFNKHLELKPDDEDAQYWKSICLHALKRYEEALDCISRVRYHIADSYYLRAICLRDKGEEKKIVVYWFRKYLTALPSNDKRKAEALRFIDEYKKSIGGIRGFFS
jgi:tetratricopeptide (TPR) repeat protein